MLRDLPTIEFERRGECVRVFDFLLQHVAVAEPEAGRRSAWFTYDEACRRLAHLESLALRRQTRTLLPD